MRPPSERSLREELLEHGGVQIAIAWAVGLTLATLGVGLAVIVVLVVAKILGL